MMILSRGWYFVIGVLMAMAFYVSYLAVGQYNRRNQVAMTEGLTSDSQTVRWALQIDARRRLDSLLIAAVDKGLQDSLVGAATPAKEKQLPKFREDARKALDNFNSKLAPDLKFDALFAVDRDGKVLAQVGFDQANAFEDFELGGYPAVNDALHGFLRDDTWVLGNRIYRVSARSVEYSETQPPAGAVVALRLVDARYALEISKQTHANVAFFADGLRVSSAVPPGNDSFDERSLEQLASELPQVEADKAYREGGRSGIRLLEKDNLGAVFMRFDGDAWEQRAGFAVARSRVAVSGPFGFIDSADDKDRSYAPWGKLALAAILLGLIGVGLTFIEHGLPLREMKRQARRLHQGEIDLLQIARFRGAYRPIATDLNAGIERVAEKGGAPRKLADVEKIMGPIPAQPAMSAFAFPGPDGAGPPSSSMRSDQPPPFVPPGNRGPASAPAVQEGGRLAAPPGPGARHAGASGGFAAAEVPSRPGLGARPQEGRLAAPPPPMQAVHGVIAQGGTNANASGALYAASARAIAAPPQAAPAQMPDESGRTALSPPGSGKRTAAQSGPHAMVPTAGGPAAGAPPPVPGKPPPPPGPNRISRPQGAPPPAPPRGAPPPVPPPRPGISANIPAARPVLPSVGSLHRPETSPTSVAPLSPEARALLQEAKDDGRDPANGKLGMGEASRGPHASAGDEEPATVVGSAPRELLAKAAGPNNEEGEWRIVYEDFIRTKKQCGESTEGLTFAKFQHTLKKNRDALIQRHGCKRVRFSVYVKEGRASLKATPVKD